MHSLSQPLVLVYLAIGVAIGELWYRRRLDSRRLAVLTSLVALLWVVSMPATANLALGSLEWQYPPRQDVPPDVDAIVVLGGNLLPPPGYDFEPKPGPSTLYRCMEAADAYNRAGGCPIVVSGGRVPPESSHALAEVMQRFLVKLGIPASDLIVEAKSTTTYENAVEVRRTLKKREISKILLVTDAAHLRRAGACFVAQGFQVVPRGCRYRAVRFPWNGYAFLPESEAPALVAYAAHEWLGLLWYWTRGRI